MFYRVAAALLLAVGVTFAADTKPPAKPDEPMAGNMKRPGMKQGDVKKQAEKKRRAMKPMLEQEEKEMQGRRSPAGAR